MASRPRNRSRQNQPRPPVEPAGFSALSKADQIRYLQALWDSIAKKPGQIPVPDSHLVVAEERLAEYRRDPSRSRPARDAIERLTRQDR
jgi:putative addiction module component (TIGR02574 family)